MARRGPQQRKIELEFEGQNYAASYIVKGALVELHSAQFGMTTRTTRPPMNPSKLYDLPPKTIARHLFISLLHEAKLRGLLPSR